MPGLYLIIKAASGASGTTGLNGTKAQELVVRADGETCHCRPGEGGGSASAAVPSSPIKPLLGKSKDWGTLLEGKLKLINV